MKKERTNRTAKFMVIFMAAIMIFSVFGVIFFGYNRPASELDYKDISFTRDERENKWSTVINNKEAIFDYFPTEVEEINISQDIISKLSSTFQIDTTYDYNDTFAKNIELSIYKLSQMLNFHFNIYVGTGFTTNTSYNRPTITCKDATPFVPIIYFKESNNTLIYKENNCIIIEAKNGPDFIRIKDRLLYSLFGII